MENVMILVTVFFSMAMGFASGIKMGWDMKKRSDKYDAIQAKKAGERNREQFFDNYHKCY